jgi:uncharacterized protein (UPF0264 family)
MHLLISVSTAAEAIAALAGGADLIDAKDPRTGALGAVSRRAMHEILLAVGSGRPVTAALGDAWNETGVERRAATFAAAGVALVKVGFGWPGSAVRIGALTAAAVRGASAGNRTCKVVAVAYADRDGSGRLRPADFVEAAARAGAYGFLLDTANKSGPGLLDVVSRETLATWVAAARQSKLLVALAGRLTAADLADVRDAGADIAGVRGAACEGGRNGHVTAARVAWLRAMCDRDCRANREAASPHEPRSARLNP